MSPKLSDYAPESLPRALHATLRAAFKPELSREELRRAIITNAPPWLRSPTDPVLPPGEARSNFEKAADSLAFYLHTGVLQIGLLEPNPDKAEVHCKCCVLMRPSLSEVQK